MRKVFSILFERAEKFFQEEKYLTECERSILRTVLSDFKGSINTGRFDKERKHPLVFEVCKLELVGDHIVYFQHEGMGYAVNRIPVGKVAPSFERLQKALEELGFETDMSKVIQIKNHPNPISVMFTIPGKD